MWCAEEREQCASCRDFILSIWKIHFQRGLQWEQVFRKKKGRETEERELVFGYFHMSCALGSTWKCPEDSGRQRNRLGWRYELRALPIDSITPSPPLSPCAHTVMYAVFKNPRLLFCFPSICRSVSLISLTQSSEIKRVYICYHFSPSVPS